MIVIASLGSNQFHLSGFFLTQSGQVHFCIITEQDKLFIEVHLIEDIIN